MRYEIPLSPEPQTFQIALAGVTYTLTLKWNVPANCWVLDIEDQDGIQMISGIPLVTGSDLLEQYAYLGFGGTLTAETDHDTCAPPTYDNLGTTGHVYFTV